MTMNLKELSDELKAVLKANEARAEITPPAEPPIDGSKLPPITGNAKLVMSGDGVVASPPRDSTKDVSLVDPRDLPPITGRMAVTEPLDMTTRRKLKVPVK